MGEEDERIGEIIYFLAPAILSAAFVAVPLENILSEFPFQYVFPWYPPWRGALVSFIIWVTAGFVLSEKREWSKLIFGGSAASFTVFHYISLIEVVMKGYAVAIYPFFYTVGESPLHVDLAQVILVLTAIALKKDIARLLKH